MKSTLIAVALALSLLAGCLSVAQRDQVLLDLATAKASITLIYPAGADRDKWLAELDKATSVEELIQIRARAAQAAGITVPANVPTTQPSK